MTDKSPRSVSVARRNGLIGQVNRYLNTIGSWSTYRDLDSIEAIPHRLAQVTAAYLGLKGVALGHPRLAGLLGVVIAVHALEQLTGGLATAGMRLCARGRPLATYRGLLIRPSPFTPRTVRLLNRLTGGRVLAARGYYFFEAGKTWHCQSLTFHLGDQPRTLTWVQSFSLPQREFFFDRPVVVSGEQEPAAGEKTIAIQRVVDVVKGEEDPDTVPGFLGSVNELEGLTPLRGVKQALFMADWLLIDPGERDGGGGGYADYEALVKGTPPGGGSAGSGGVYLVPSPAGGPPTGSGWPSTTRLPLRPSHSSPQSAWPASVPSPPPPPPPPPHESELFGSGPAVQSHPAIRYKDRLRIGHKDYPLVVKRVVRSPFNGDERKADAVYYDEVGLWREVVNEEDRLSLARAVEEGRLTLVEPAQWPR
jgi:hypothetical protein